MMNRNTKSYKIERASAEIKRVIEEVVTNEIKNPKVCGNVAVTDIVLSSDLSNCKVYVDVLNGDIKTVIENLGKAAGFVRHSIAETLDMRRTPEVKFFYDDTIEKRKRIEELLEQIK